MKVIPVFLILGTVIACGAQESKHNIVPEAGYVPNAEVAIKIAVAVWEPIYGVGKIAEEKPYRAKLANEVWTVEGSLPAPSKGMTMIGGTAVAEISKKDGHIIRISHSM